MAKQRLIIKIPGKRCLIAGLRSQIVRFDGGRAASDQLRMQMNKQVQTVEAAVFSARATASSPWRVCVWSRVTAGAE